MTMKEQFRIAGAPQYDPDLWNNRLTDEALVKAFCDDPVLQKIMGAEMLGNERVIDLFKKGEINPDTKEFMARAAYITMSSVTGYSQMQVSHDEMAALYAITPAEFSAASDKLSALDKLRGFQDNTTCYDYAVNDPDRDSIRNSCPGQISGLVQSTKLYYDTSRFDEFVAEVIKGTEADGAEVCGVELPETNGSNYRIAVFVRPSETITIADSFSIPLPADYHYMRQDSDGTWSHKPGEEEVTNLDYSGDVITDPRAADVGKYQFIAFGLVPAGGLDVGPRDCSNGVPNGNNPDYDMASPSSVVMKSILGDM